MERFQGSVERRQIHSAMRIIVSEKGKFAGTRYRFYRKPALKIEDVR